ncbi:hypothetical protein KUCAC02_031405, partial [Chaenocephalus aceratus]
NNTSTATELGVVDETSLMNKYLYRYQQPGRESPSRELIDPTLTSSAPSSSVPPRSHEKPSQ